jgi:hypothetical protein
MNKEQQELLDAAHMNYVDQTMFSSDRSCFKLVFCMDMQTGEETMGCRQYTKEEFINQCKTDTEFTQKWGLKIEERELSLEEKEWQLEKTNCINDIENDRVIYGHKWEKYIQEQYEGIQLNQGIKIPTKLITLEYNGIKIESYE